MAKLYKRGDTYYSDLYSAGQRVRKPLSTDRRTAENKLADLIKLRDATKHFHAPRDTSWREFCKQYLEQSRQEKKKPTWQGEERAFRWLESVIPIQRLSQLTPAILDRVKTLWLAKKRGVYVINRDLRSIRTAIHKAEAWGFIPKQDWSTNRYIKTPKGRLRFYSADELKALKKVCHGIWRSVLYLGAQAGLRRAEMYHLEWSDVDFERNRLHIAPKEGWVPKDFERRWVPMTEDLAAYLKQLASGRTQGWVLSDKGERPSLESMSVYFRRLVKKARVRDGSIHTLRHTFGSNLAAKGAPAKAIQELMGHASIQVTELYMHLAPNDLNTAVKRLDPL